MSPRVAPRARRVPICLVRSATESDVSPDHAQCGDEHEQHDDRGHRHDHEPRVAVELIFDVGNGLHPDDAVRFICEKPLLDQRRDRLVLRRARCGSDMTCRPRRRSCAA